MSRYTKSEIEEAQKWCEQWLNPGDTVHTVLRHVSRSGMTRGIDLYVFRNYGTDDDHGAEPIYLSHAAATLLGYSMHRNGGVSIGGCGMDMGFALVYELSHKLWPKGFKTPPGYCRNEPMDFDPDGGYALKHAWM